MERRPIPTEEEAQRATARIGALLDAAPATPEGGEPDLPAPLVDARDRGL